MPAASLSSPCARERPRQAQAGGAAWVVVEVRTLEDERLRTKASSDTGETGELSQHTAFCQSPVSREVPMGWF